MSLKQAILDHLAIEPGLTNIELSQRLGARYCSVSGTTTTLFNQDKLTRQQVAGNGGRPQYRYALATTPPVQDKPAGPSSPLTRTTLDDMVAQLAEAVVTRVKAQVETLLAQEVERMRATTMRQPADLLAYATPPAGPRLKVVLVVGLLPAQAGMIQAEFHTCFDLKFWKDESLHKLKAMAGSADFVLVMTGKVSHKTTDALKTVAHYEPIRGGLTSLREFLTNLYCVEEV